MEDGDDVSLIEQLEEEPDWECGVCASRNRSFRFACDMCTSRRVQPTAPPITLHVPATPKLVAPKAATPLKVSPPVHSPPKATLPNTAPLPVTPGAKFPLPKSTDNSTPQREGGGAPPAATTDLQCVGRQLYELLLGAGDSGATTQDLLDFYSCVHSESLLAKITRMGYLELHELLSDLNPVFVVFASSSSSSASGGNNKLFAAGTAEANRIVSGRRAEARRLAGKGPKLQLSDSIVIDEAESKEEAPPSASFQSPSSCSSSSSSSSTPLHPSPLSGPPPPFVDEDEEVCSVCLVEPQELVCDPCGHLALCRVCAAKVHVCPICSATFSKLIQVYRA